MRKLKFVFGRKSFQTIYVSFNRPLVEYADVVWDTAHSTKQTSLKTSRLKLRILTGATRLLSLKLLVWETGCDTLACKRNKHKIIMFYKMYTGLSPPCLSAILPATFGANVSYNLRNPNNLQTE